MKCTRFLQLLPLYVGGDLDHDEFVSADAHLESCASCKSEMRSASQAHEALLDSRLLTSSDSPSIWDELQPRLDASDAMAQLRRPILRRVLGWVPTAAAILALAVGLNLLLPSMQVKEVAPPQALAGMPAYFPIALPGMPGVVRVATPAAPMPAEELIEVSNDELRHFLERNGALLRDARPEPNRQEAATPAAAQPRRF